MTKIAKLALLLATSIGCKATPAHAFQLVDVPTFTINKVVKKQLFLTKEIAFISLFCQIFLLKKKRKKNEKCEENCTKGNDATGEERPPDSGDKWLRLARWRI